MSVSKLESLSNEILLDLLEKYINGVDIFVAFAIELNRRFDGLIAQCQQLHFDFESIRKNDFRLCIGLLPDYIDIIESLNLSERDTPGQIHAFLSFFPKFDQFKRLRRVRLNFDGKAVEKNLLNTAILSLSKTNTRTLSMKGINAHDIFQSDDVILAVFATIALRRLFIAVDTDVYRWDFRVLTSFNVKHLTIGGRGCTWDDLKAIFKCATRLSYLNARIVYNSSYSFGVPVVEKRDGLPIIKLHTLILQFIRNDSLNAIATLGSYLSTMPNLRHLEIIDDYGRFLDGYAWQKILETSLPLLSHFVLKSGVSSIGEYHLLHVLTSFQTLFWIAKKNFNVFIIQYRHLDDDIALVYLPISSSFFLNVSKENEQGSRSFWTIPQRCENNNCLLAHNLTTLYLSGDSSILPTQHYLNNVKRITVKHLNLSLFRWITMNIDLLNLTELLIPHLETETDQFYSLLAHAKNISSLQIHYKQLFDEYSAPIGEYNSIRRLDISVGEHPFQREDIIVLQKLFPSIEHLKINTIDLHNVPLLNAYLPKLHSLTLKLDHLYFLRFGDYLGEHWDYQVRSQTQFLFKCTNEWITIWVDQATFEESFWQFHQTTDSYLNHESSLTSQKVDASVVEYLPA